MTEFGRSYVEFVCACLNDRANGTIHYGVKEIRSTPPVDGEVVGVILKKDVKIYQEFLTKAIQKCFQDPQAKVALKCVEPAKFLKVVVSDDAQICDKYVIDIDVIPNHSLCKECVFSVSLPTRESGIFNGPYVIRTKNGIAQPLHDEEIFHFQKVIIQDLDKQRKELEEQLQNSKNQENIDTRLCDKFIKLLCHGDETFQGDHYEILVINKPDTFMDEEFMKNSLSFLSAIQWRAIFDFDSEAKIHQFVQDHGMNVIDTKTEDFNSRSDENIDEPEKLRDLHEKLKTSVNPAWIFVNGNDQTNDQKLTPLPWKKSKSEGFKEAVRFFGNQIPKGRAIVVFVLLSSDTDIVLEAAEEFITMFEGEWMCVADNEGIGKPWMDELVRRHCVEEYCDRYIWNVPWNHVQKTVYKLLGPRRRTQYEIPTSKGGLIKLGRKDMNDFIDIEILSSTECENPDIQYEAKSVLDFEREIREEYYKGTLVSWWNFWFQDQVCKREISKKIEKQVRKALDGGEQADIVGRVFLYHQPGAGGTTVARHVLWDLRKLYRCGIIPNITEESMLEQILNLYWHAEELHPKPLLLLLDTPDVEKVNLLFVALSERARRFERRRVNDQSNAVLCVFLICARCTKVKSSSENKFYLQHELSPRELRWFEDRNKSLIKEFQNKENTLINPKLLISFNLMKEGFDKNYIKQTVKQFVDNITDENERNLLKYVSLLNAYDFENRAIPTASFDGMMIKIPWLQKGPRWGSKAISMRWETSLSSDIRVLLNETSRPALGQIHSLRLTSVLLAKDILSILRSSTASVSKISDIVLELLSSRETFNVNNVARNSLVGIFKDVLRRRQPNANGRPETKFSLLIEDIIKLETTQNAIIVMEKALELFPDPYTEQQLARLFMTVQEWDNAIRFAKRATDQQPDNSFFWHTYGRIYEEQLMVMYANLVKGTHGIAKHDIVPLIKIASEGMRIHRIGQTVGTRNKENNAGFYGELQIAVHLLDCLTYFFHDKQQLKNSIQDPKYIPEEFSFLADFEGKDYLEELKALEQHTVITMNRLQDEVLQLRQEALDYRGFESNNSLLRLKENLNDYFGEDNDEVPDDLEVDQQCQYRRRRISRLAGHNISSIFELRKKDDADFSTLQLIRDMAMENIATPHVNATDYQIIISANLALTFADPRFFHDDQNRYSQMVTYSQKLYEMRNTSHLTHLEPYLYFVLFNWPRKDSHDNVVPKVIESAIKHWKEAFWRKYPIQKIEAKEKKKESNRIESSRKKETTMFFFANGSGMASITTFEELGSQKSMAPRGRDTFWKRPETITKLRRFEGHLRDGGNEVIISLPYGQRNTSNLSIATSYPIENIDMFGKKVFFVIGLSWIGPKAYDISLKDPTEGLEKLPARTANDSPRSFRSSTYHSKKNISPENLTQRHFNQKLESFDKELFMIENIKKKKEMNALYEFTPLEVFYIVPSIIIIF